MHVCDVVRVNKQQQWVKGLQAGYKVLPSPLVNWQVENSVGMRMQRSGRDYEITQNQISEVAVFVWLECKVKWENVQKENCVLVELKFHCNFLVYYPLIKLIYTYWLNPDASLKRKTVKIKYMETVQYFTSSA